jgi:hypothetical protein
MTPIGKHAGRWPMSFAPSDTARCMYRRRRSPAAANLIIYLEGTADDLVRVNR